MPQNVKLSVGNLNWCIDDTSLDLCAHGSVEFFVGDYQISDHSDSDWCVSATALHFLRTLSRNHTDTDPVGEHLITHFGNTMYESFDSNDVYIGECGIGININVTHDEGYILLETKTDEPIKLRIEKAKWQALVYEFADSVQRFYDESLPKKLTEDYMVGGYTAFWSEWHRRRNYVTKSLKL
jgi:hypothetical protein